MVVRKRRKKNKLMGQRTRGAGNTKNRRGAGSRGGRGASGENKHKWNSGNRYKEPNYKLKNNAANKREISVGKLCEMIDGMVAKGRVKKDGEYYIVDKKSKYNKLLSQGEADKKIIVRINASMGAIKKILSAGGKFEYKKKGVDEKELSTMTEDDEFEVDETLTEEDEQ